MNNTKQSKESEELKVKGLTKIINEFFKPKGYEQVDCMIEFCVVPAENPLRRMLAPVGLVNKLKSLKWNQHGAFDIVPGYLTSIRIRHVFPVDYLFFQYKEFDKRHELAHEFAEYYKEKTGFDAVVK